MTVAVFQGHRYRLVEAADMGKLMDTAQQTAALAQLKQAQAELAKKWAPAFQRYQIPF